jgi:hypothetical protein
LTDGYGADRDWIRARYEWHLATLAEILPERFHAKLNEARTSLPKLFNDGYPTVLDHAELTEDNVHVDPNTGHITGLVGWLDAAVRPFGLSLWGLDSILGVQTTSEWHWHHHHAELRQQFWTTFTAAVGPLTDNQIMTIKLGRMVGIFLAFPADFGPVKDLDDPSVVFLEGLLGVE